MKTKLSWFDRIMAAVTFAEANEYGSAKELLKGAISMTENEQHCEDSDVCFTTDLQGAKVNS